MFGGGFLKFSAKSRHVFVTCPRDDENVFSPNIKPSPCFPIASFSSFHITMATSHQTPSDWLIKYSALCLRAGKGCLGDDDDEEEDEEEEEEG